MDDTTDIDAMAAAMGFSNFGAQPGAKRRKYNPRADNAFVASSSTSASLASEAQSASAKGANAIPLGARSGNNDSNNNNNKDEISLDDDDDEGPGPQYIDTSRPPAPAEAATSLQDTAAAQTRIDTIVEATKPPAHSHHGGRGGHRQRGGGRGGGGGGDGRHGGKLWYEDYYDPAFNMNPWEKLEKENGLQPLSNDWLTWEDSKARWEEVKMTIQKSEGQAPT